MTSPIYVQNDDQGDSESLDEEIMSEYQEYLARRSLAVQRNGVESSWMFQRDAEEHYFGSIVEISAIKIKDPAMGSTLAKAVDKRD